jgi:response regulator of citrate/malate metabolism
MSSPLRVLVVDDDFMVATIHRKFVERVDGFEVVGEARSGQEAMAAVAELAPDLVLLDIYLPDMSGLDVLRRLRSDAHPVDVLVVTAARDMETVQESLRGGAVQYLIKPFTAEAMRDRLVEFARRFRSVQDAGQGDGDDGPREVGQREVDAIFGLSHRPAGAQLPKGLTLETLRLVAGALREHAAGDPATLSAAECADRVGLARVSARRYLEHLVSAGYAEVSLKYGGAGRPERRYRWLG